MLVGCNQVFGLDSTELVDDNEVPVDPMCPPRGEQPSFRSEVKELLHRECFNYTTDAAGDRAVAFCTGGDPSWRVEEGPNGGPLAPVDVPVPPDHFVQTVWFTPEGDQLVVKHYRTVAPNIHRLSMYRRDGSGWAWSSDISERDGFMSGGVPSARPNRRIIETAAAGWRELEEQGTTWVEVRAGAWQELGLPLSQGNDPNLSPDGLRLTFVDPANSLRVRYTDRATLADPFRPAVLLDTGAAQNAFLANDCSRLYFSSAPYIYFRYLQQ